MEIDYQNLIGNYNGKISIIVDFYRPRYKRKFSETTVVNSSVVCLAFHDGKIVGAVRAISDMERHSLIVDLVVEKEYRHKGIGSNLLQNISKELRTIGVQNIYLMTDPQDPGLVEFYEKNGFKRLDGSINMEYFD